MASMKSFLKQEISLEKILLTAILVLAAFFRFYNLDRLPPGLRFDEAFNLSDILTMMEGPFTIFFPANNGREPFFNYLAIVGTMLFGANPIALRINSAILGTATVFLTFGFAKALFHSSRIALLAAFFLAISTWHTYYSRYGLRVILCLALTILTLWFFWRAITLSQQSRAETRYYILAGIFSAMTAYTYLSGRLTPLLLIALTVAAIAINRKNWRIYLQGLGITGIVAFVLFIPLGAYFVTHPQDFLAHGTTLSIWDPAVSHGDVTGTFFSNVAKVAGMFFVRGDYEDFRNVPEHPAFDPLLGALFVVGIIVMLRDLLMPKSTPTSRLRAFLIAAGMLLFLSSSILSDQPPNFTRTLPTLSVLILLPAWGASEIYERLRNVSMQKFAIGAFGLIALVSTIWSYNDYFVRFANLPSLYYGFDVRMYDVAQWINQNARTHTVYLAPLWYQQGTLALLTRQTPLKSFESRDTIVLPSSTSGKDALYAFPPEQEKKAAKLAERLGTIAKRESVLGSTGEQILIVYRVPSANLPNLQSTITTLLPDSDLLRSPKSLRAQWEDSFEILGYSVNALDTPKRNLEVTLIFRALKRIEQDYTFSVKVRDSQDRVWGQEDKWLGTNSYATPQMSEGDVIVEKFYPGLSACAPADNYRISIEAYNPTTMQTWDLASGGNVVQMGTTRAEASQGNRYEDLEPDEQRSVEAGSKMYMFGFSLSTREGKPGEPFSLSLFWRGYGDGANTHPIGLYLIDSAKQVLRLSLPTITMASEGRGTCTFFDLRVPSNATPGKGTLMVNDVDVAKFDVIK